MIEFILLLLTYVAASIPFGLIVGKVFGSVDVRRVGSGNIGTSNVMRAVGKGPAALVLLLDVLKGAVPVWIAIGLGMDAVVVAAVGLVAVVGHVWSVFLGFDGGKGIATTLGVMIAFDGTMALTLVLLWITMLVLTRYISVASLTAAVWLPLGLLLFGNSWPYVAAGLLISAVAFWRHKSNLQRLRMGNEYRFGESVGKAERR